MKVSGKQLEEGAGQDRPGPWRGRGGGREGTQAGSSGLAGDTGIRGHTSGSGSPAPGPVGPATPDPPPQDPPSHLKAPPPLLSTLVLWMPRP